ncbi:MAG: tryptophan 7-halogenase [Planctomycetota bacterium]
MTPSQREVDVLVIGGGLGGSSTALLLARARPDLRIVVVERTEHFDRKVGEATVEVSGYFLAHVLGLFKTLSHQHLFKHGLRYYFSDGQGRSLAEMTEVGAVTQPSLASFQLDRSLLDETVLEHARQAGAEVLRPAKVKRVEHGWPTSEIEVESDDSTETLRARWIIDASGRQAFLARRKQLLVELDGHRTSAMWGRWRGTLDLDRTQPPLPRLKTSRLLATNHFAGHGWWAWVIPLANGDTSIGLVWDTKLFAPPPASTTEARYRDFLASHDGLREVVAGAELIEGDFTLRERLAYRSTQYADRGWALIGDAAAFLDPYYSPGLDHVAMSVTATTNLVLEDVRDRCDDALDAKLALHNERFVRSTTRWYDALYRDKYELFGDAELTAAAFAIDTAMYYLGVVQPVYRDPGELGIPTLGREGWKASLAFKVLRFVNRRLVRLARNRRARGTYGRRNVGWRWMVSDFGSAKLRLTSAHRKGLGLWLAAEWHDFAARFLRTRQPVDARAAEARAS